MIPDKNISIYIPDGADLNTALQRTSSLCIAAHQDDTEIMAYNAIIDAYDKKDKWFTSVIVTDGGGSPRNGNYAEYTDCEMKKIRASEQNLAALIGKYSAQIQLSYHSSSVKSVPNILLETDLINIISACKPEIVWTHNLADKHDTHVAVALHTIRAARQIHEEMQQIKIYGMEVWRSLDWLFDDDKAVFDASGHENLSGALIGVYDSQICGSKRYDLAVLGRRKANATFLEDHKVDKMKAAIYAMDMSELLINSELMPDEFIVQYIDRFRTDVIDRINHLNIERETI